MRKIFILCFLFVVFAMAQRQRVVVLPSLADAESKLTPKQLDLLTEDIRTVVTKTLPSMDFLLLKQDEVMKRLGDQAFVKACKEGVCLGSLVDDLEANFGARCEIYAVGEQLYMRFELYGTLKGQSAAGTIDQFNDPVKNFADMQAKIKAKVPGIFEMIIKSPQQVCEAKGKEWAWINGDCKSYTQIARETCVAMGNTWINEECKSQAQIACEVMAGRKWTGEECKTGEQIERDVGSIKPRDYTVHFESTPSQAFLNFEGKTNDSCSKTPCKAELKKGNTKVLASLDLYEAKDTTIFVSGDNQRIQLNLKPNYGILNLRTKGEGWNLIVDNKHYSINDVKLSPGTYKVKLTHECYEDIDLNASIKKDTEEVIDITDKITPKKGNLDLHVKYKGREQKEPVFINGQEVGKTPFNEIVLVCTDKVELGKDKEFISLYDLKRRKYMEYTHNKSTENSTLLGLALGAASGGLLFLAYDQYTKTNKYMDEYNKLSSGMPLEYKNLRKKAKDANDKMSLFLISGGVLGVSAIGVVLWF